MRKTCPILLLLGMIFLPLTAGKASTFSVHPDHENHLYQLGDTVTFTIDIPPDGNNGGDSQLRYRLSQDGGRQLGSGTLELTDGRATLRASLNQPGFLRCDLKWFDGADTLRAACGCGFNVEAIRPSGQLPADFERFWRQAAAELVRIPMDPRLELVEGDDLPAGARRYRISLAGTGGARVLGWLTFPAGEGPFPAVLSVPGAGVGATSRETMYARAGLAVLSINVHGIEPDREKEYYKNLSDNVYHTYDYFFYGKADPYHYYFRRVIQDCMRAIDYLHSHQDVDTTRLAISGGSQGGFLSLMLTSLDKRIKAAALCVPGMCDHAGKLHGKHNEGLLEAGDNPEDVLRTLSYFDAALAASRIEVPILMAVGYIDGTCPPSTVFAAFNNLRGSREMVHFVDKPHNIGWHEWKLRAGPWLLAKMNELTGK